MAYQCLSKERGIYLRKDSAKAIENVRKIVFDFDGVLVYTSESYRQTIRKVVDYYFLDILGLEGERGKLATIEDVQKFKDTGSYNNDWNLSYGIIAYYLSIIIHELPRHGFYEFTKRFSNLQLSELPCFLQTLREIGDFLTSYGIRGTDLINIKNDPAKGLESFLTQAKMKNQRSLETNLVSVLPQIGDKETSFVRKMIPYDLEKPDLLKRLFEESYLGEKLFSEFYGVPAMFKFEESLLEKEAFVPTHKTLDALREKFDKFAIYSEKPGIQGMYLLNKSRFKEYFDKKQFFFQEGLTESAGSILGKPNPTFFIELIEDISLKNGGIAYVGDGVADILLVRNARMKGLCDLLFFGVMCSTQNPRELLSQYFKYDADVIMTDVNDLPCVFANLGK